MTKEELLSVYPEINLIPDNDTKKIAIEAFLLGIEEGEWDKKGGVINCPVAAEGLLKETCNVSGLDHMRCVSKAADAIGRCLKPWLELVNYDLDMNFTIAGAVLHDVGKLIEFDRDQNNIPRYSKYGKMFCHTSAGAWLVKKSGGSDVLTHAVLTHSHAEAPEQANAFEKPENIIIKGCDLCNYEEILVAWKQDGVKVTI